MSALFDLISGFLPSHKQEPAQEEKPDNLTTDQVAYLREIADKERKSWATNKGRS